MYENITTLHEHFNSISTCPLKATATQPVFGKGNPKADIVFIGEAPGKNEDLEGAPFVGRSGEFLSEMLASINMKREDIYITNIVKYRPPNNRDPLPEEKEQCAPWLHAELDFIKPKIIIFLGRHSMQHFLPKLIISQAHGKLVHAKLPHIHTEYFLPLFHPAAALYNQSLKETLMEDFKKIPGYIAQIDGQQTRYIE